MREPAPVAYYRLNMGGMIAIHPVDMRAGRQLLNETFARCMREQTDQVVTPPLALYLLAASQKNYCEWSMEQVVKSNGFIIDHSFAGFYQGAEAFGKPAFVHPEAVARFLASRKRKDRVYAQALITLITEFRYCLTVLSNRPILAPTREMQPKMQPRTYADMTNQRASEITTLPNYTARARFLSSGEQVVKTRPLPPPVSGAELTERLRRIKRQMWAKGYTRYYKEVEKEIRQREERLRGSADSDEPPPTHF